MQTTLEYQIFVCELELITDEKYSYCSLMAHYKRYEVLDINITEYFHLYIYLPF
jgi:hypothetical protein